MEMTFVLERTDRTGPSLVVFLLLFGLMETAIGGVAIGLIIDGTPP